MTIRRDWLGWLAGNRTMAILLGCLGMGGVTVVDYLTGTEIGFSIFYLAPLFLIAFVTGPAAATVAAVAAALLRLLADFLADPSPEWHMVWNAGVRLAFFELFVLLFQRLRGMLEAEQRLARIDVLTGLPNGRAFFEAAAVEFARCRRHSHPLAVAYIDCDNFKEVNDRFGHDVGDEVLRVVATSLRQTLRASDFLARLAGDEFGVVLPETDSEAAETVASKVVTGLESAMKGRGWPVTLSVGVAVYLAAPDPVRQVLSTADGLMYTAKAAGKNRYHVQVFRQ